MQDFRKLDVWREAHVLTLEVFRFTQRFARMGHGTLCTQVRRAVAAIPTNIVEGCGHESWRELNRFLGYALASATEVEYHLLLSRDLGLLRGDAHEALDERTIRVKRMLVKLRQRIEDANKER